DIKLVERGALALWQRRVKRLSLKQEPNTVWVLSSMGRFRRTVLTLHVRFDPDGKLDGVTWEGVGGCMLCRASTSYVTGLVPEMTVEELEQMRDEDLIEQLGREVAMLRQQV
ncbi:MAG: hypothetical protein WCD86_13105, partial [Ktedonobacteraceae bacterium]